MLFQLKEEHIKLIKELNFKTRVCMDAHEDNRYKPVIDGKRPFGNSGIVSSACEILGLHPKDDDTGYDPADIEKVESLVIELPVALEIVMRQQTFTPGMYEVCEFSAYFNYRHIRNYHALKQPLAEIDRNFTEKIGYWGMQNIHTCCMNISSDDPYDVIQELKDFDQAKRLTDIIAVFEKYKEESEHAK